MKRTRLRLVAYIRVSTARQAERYGPATQRADIRAWATKHGHTITKWVTESSTGTVFERDGLGEVLALLKNGKAHGMVVGRLDRLARDLIVQETIAAKVWLLGGELMSAAEGEANLRDDPNDPSRKLIRQVLGAVSEYNAAMVRLMLRNGRKAKARAGGYSYGAPPYGWRAVNKTLLKHPKEQATLRRAAELRAGGSSLRAIADMLAAEGMKPRRGNRWDSSTLNRALTRFLAEA
ncbi:recombinase family protein [Amycolatopsis sp. NPDC051106]|uniref:recombinase family protein n=1 Tax=unclassified Amycolatopsis TaxID=2618356 RepID=UPI00342FD884